MLSDFPFFFVFFYGLSGARPFQPPRAADRCQNAAHRRINRRKK